MKTKDFPSVIAAKKLAIHMLKYYQRMMKSEEIHNEYKISFKGIPKQEAWSKRWN